MSAPRVIPLSTKITGFDGKPILDENEESWTLKRVLLHYCRLSNKMHTKDNDLTDIYGLACKVGASDEETMVVTQKEYDLLKGLVDDGKLKAANGPGHAILLTDLQYGAKKLIDEADKHVEPETPPVPEPVENGKSASDWVTPVAT